MITTGAYVVRWVASRIGDHGNFGVATQAIGWERNGRLVAGVVYADYNGPNVWCHIASEGSHWLTRRYLWAIFDYPFNQMNVKRITCPVGEGNSKSRRFVEKLGFKAETTLRAAHPTGDLLLYSMFKESCRWIGSESLPRFAKAA